MSTTILIPLRQHEISNPAMAIPGASAFMVLIMMFVVWSGGWGTLNTFKSGAGNLFSNPRQNSSSLNENLWVGRSENQEDDLGQTITFNPLTPVTYGDPAITLSATASSGLPVTFESDNPSVATISGNSLTIVGAGTANITASQDGDETYDPAPDVTQVLTVNKANLSAKADNKTKIYGDANPALTITYTGFKGSDDATVLDTPPTIATTVTQFSPVDSYDISFMTDGIDNNYTFTLTDGILTITQAPLSVKSDNKTKIYGDLNPELTISYTGFKGTDDASVIDTPPAISTTATQFSAAESYLISFLTEGADDNYAITSYTEGSLTITKASLTATADNKTRAYGAPDPVFTITYTGFKGSDNASVIDVHPLLATDATQFSPVNDYAIAFITGGADNNYEISALNDGTLTIIKANQSIDFPDITGKTVFDPPFTPTATSTSGLPVAFSSSDPAIISFSGTTASIHSSGTVIITASQSGDTNYNAANDVEQEVLVNDKMYQTITFSELPTKAFGTPQFDLTATATSGLPVSYTSSNPLVATITGSTVTLTGVGTTTITASQSGNASYEPAADVEQVLTVEKGDQVITFAAISDKTLGDPAFAISATSTSNLEVAFEAVTSTISVSGNLVTMISAGPATLRAIQSGNDLYNAAEAVTQSFCVNPAKPTVTVTNNNGPEPTLTSSAASGNQWYRDGILIPGATNTIYIAIEPGSYSVKVKVGTCESVASDPVSIIITGDIRNHTPDVSIHPNPVDDRLEADFSGFESGLIEVFFIDPLGRILERHLAKNGRETFDLRQFSAGSYYLVVTQASHKISKKIIKK